MKFYSDRTTGPPVHRNGQEHGTMVCGGEQFFKTQAVVSRKSDLVSFFPTLPWGWAYRGIAQTAASTALPPRLSARSRASSEMVLLLVRDATTMAAADA